MPHMSAPVIGKLYDKGSLVFQVLFLVSFFVGNFVGFLVALRFLKVQKSLNKRALFLSLCFLAIQVVSAVVTGLIGLVEPAGLVLSIILFSFVLRKVLIIKLWQVIVIPIGVSIFSSVILGVLLMLAIGLFGPISVS
jgi:hypothetical protein